jgi:hypothetical protein
MSRGCTGCTRLVTLVHQTYARGGYTRGWRVKSISRVGPGLFELHVLVAPTAVKESSSSPVRHLPGGPASFRLHISPQGPSWNVTALVQVAT